MMSVQKKLLEHRHRAINKNMNVLVLYSCLSRTKAIALMRSYFFRRTLVYENDLVYDDRMPVSLELMLNRKSAC